MLLINYEILSYDTLCFHPTCTLFSYVFQFKYNTAVYTTTVTLPYLVTACWRNRIEILYILAQRIDTV